MKKICATELSVLIWKLAVQDKNIISAGPGEPDFITSKRVMNYGSKLLAKGYSTHYSPPEEG